MRSSLALREVRLADPKPQTTPAASRPGAAPRQGGGDKGLGSLFLRLYRLLSPQLRRELYVVAAALLAGALLEIMTLGAVLPLLAMMTDPMGAWRYLEKVGLHGLAGQVPGQDIRQYVAGAFILLAVAAGAARLGLNWWTNRFVFRTGRHVAGRLFAQLIHQDYAFHLANSSSVLITRVRDARAVANNVILPFLQIATSAIIGGCIVIALLLIQPLIALSVLGGCGTVYIALSILFRRRLRASSEVVAAVNIATLKTLQESIRGIREVKLSRREERFLEDFRKLDGAGANAQAMVSFTGAAPRFIIEALAMAAIAGVALYMTARPGGLLPMLPVLAALALGAQRLLPLMQQGYRAYAQVAGNWRALSDLLDLMESTASRLQLPPRAQEPIRLEREIRLRDVAFSYDSQHGAALSRISVTIPKGARVGVIGATGSGKSTLANLILGLLAPTQGTIEVDGAPLTADGRFGWFSSVAHVPQEIVLADTTLAENIAFGVPTAEIDHERVRQAAEQAQLGAFIARLPHGYDTRPGELGSWLSGGERQRIGIARALYKRAGVIVLDEATSALDGETEAAVMEAIDKLDRELTLIIIAHRLSTIQGCDQVLRLDRGQLVSVGPPEVAELTAVRAR